MHHPLLILLIVLCASIFVSGIFLRYQVNRKRTENDYRVVFSNMDVNTSELSTFPPDMGLNLSYYKNISNISMDERCLTGKPLGVALFQYSPYVITNTFVDFKTSKGGFDIFGIFPAILKKAIAACCHPNSSVEFAKLLVSLPKTFEDYDFYFPLSGDDMDATSYHDNPFIPIVVSPKVMLLVYNDDSKETKTSVIVTTIFKAWPMLIFILLMTSCSGIIMWFLDHSKNSDDFPKPFIKGAWEGFWWAFITMTTVGYGDRFPKSYLGRFFCVIWIIFGVVNISIFTGLVTTAFFASTKSHFTIHGAKIGAVSGNKEFELGFSLNAKMMAFETSFQSFKHLLSRKVDGILVDNFVTNYFYEFILGKCRIERTFNYPITYGVTLPKNSSLFNRCARKFIMDNPQEVFERIRTSLLPVEENPADKINQQLREAEKLFYQSSAFNNILLYGGACFGAFLLFATFWKISVYVLRRRKLKKFSTKVVKDSKHSFQKTDCPVKDLIQQYNSFQDGWINKLKSVHEQ